MWWRRSRLVAFLISRQGLGFPAPREFANRAIARYTSPTISASLCHAGDEAHKALTPASIISGVISTSPAAGASPAGAALSGMTYI